MSLVLFGPPGAGKGTQSQFLVDRMQLKHISTGDLLRAAIKKQTDLGKKAQTFMDKGELVPDDVVIGLINEVVSSDPQAKYLFDGFPRTPPQAEALSTLMKPHGGISKALFLDVPSALLMDRLTGRRVCTKCGESFHVSMNPPKQEGVCDKCQGELIQRDDDKDEVISNRIKVYEENTSPLKNYYQDQGLFSSIDGQGSPEDVYSRLERALKD